MSHPSNGITRGAVSAEVRAFLGTALADAVEVKCPRACAMQRQNSAAGSSGDGWVPRRTPPPGPVVPPRQKTVALVWQGMPGTAAESG